MAIKSESRKTILVTGAEGFLGSNLITQLRLNDELVVKELTRSNSNDLAQICQDVDFVFHVAGVNRPTDAKDFQRVNVDLTKKLLEALSAQGRPIPVVFSSSSQATLDNPYGISKKEAETEVLHYGTATNSPVYVFRLSNVFGKWAKPNYNSVVATFCYNLVHDLPLRIDDPDRLLTLIHIDDVVRCFLACLENPSKSKDQFYDANPTHEISVGELAETLTVFWQSRQTQIIPDLSSHFSKALYGTLASYYKIGGLSVKPQVSSDERGWLFELVKSKQAGQVFVSSTRPGYTRGDHWHNTKVEKFTVIKGSGTLSFRHVSSNEIIPYKLSGEQIEIVDIPTGYIHAIHNDGDEDMLVLFWASEMLDKDNPDTYYEKVKL